MIFVVLAGKRFASAAFLKKILPERSSITSALLASSVGGGSIPSALPAKKTKASDFQRARMVL